MIDQLFDGYPDPVDPDEGLSQDARRTRRQQALIAQGVHPATRLPIVDNGHQCSDCAHLLTKDRYPNRWFKCAQQLHDGRGLDIRKSWPACQQWEAVS